MQIQAIKQLHTALRELKFGTPENCEWGQQLFKMWCTIPLKLFHKKRCSMPSLSCDTHKIPQENFNTLTSVRKTTTLASIFDEAVTRWVTCPDMSSPLIADDLFFQDGIFLVWPST